MEGLEGPLAGAALSDLLAADVERGEDLGVWHSFEEPSFIGVSPSQMGAGSQLVQSIPVAAIVEESLDGEPWSPVGGVAFENTMLTELSAEERDAMYRQKVLKNAIRPPIIRRPKTDGLELASIRHTP